MTQLVFKLSSIPGVLPASRDKVTKMARARRLGRSVRPCRLIELGRQLSGYCESPVMASDGKHEMRALAGKDPLALFCMVDV